MSPVSRGFHGRGYTPGSEGRVPPGQYVTRGFPVLSAGPTPHTSLEDWTFSITQGGETRKSWTWQEMRALPAEMVIADIHCVTRWSKLDTERQAVSVDTLLDQVEHVNRETASVRTLGLRLPDWRGHRAGQHLDVRLTAEDGYRAEREYLIASAPGEPVAVTVERLEDGEVSPYLTEEVRVGDELELRGLVGGYFVWNADDGRAADAGRRWVGGPPVSSRPSLLGWSSSATRQSG